MKIVITLKITPKMLADAQGNEKKALLNKQVSMIGVDFAGVRRSKEHTPTDQYCADRGTFIIENLCNMKSVLNAGQQFTAHTYPMNYADVTGLPCRVVAEI